MRNEMEVAPASIEFSISSFTTDSGLPTTSPAAMRFAMNCGNIFITLDKLLS
jgi:hypothetical protein